MIKKLLIVACGLRACANLLENIRSDSEYGFATASFIGHEHLEPLDLWGKAAILQKMLFKGNHRGSKA
jgi:hypothetical protein